MKRTLVMAAGAAVVVLIGATTALLARGDGRSAATQLRGDDFGQLRREALGLFPRGVRVATAADGLRALGFQCAPTRQILANITAPSIQCDSAGRGFPTGSRMQVTIMARNGTLSDIAIGNGIDALEADARNPDPNPGGYLPVATQDRH